MNAHANPYHNADRFNPDAPHNQKANALIEALKRSGLQKVVFFWSPLDGGSETDGAAENFPQMSAVVVLDGADGEPEYKVFDGSFLKVGGGSASYSDMQRVLDFAEGLPKGKAEFGCAVLPFTSQLTPADAVAKMLDPKLVRHHFESVTRPSFFMVRKDAVTEKEQASN
ncbi:MULTISPECIES: hypothetical protein [Pseudomonas]|jgi:hypothetical protein|uniref:Uncharacterized protein n=2 Tax=Pseudomonas TaxID=286 RepID=A0A7X1L0C8_9PSED|nr:MULTISPECIES: hypothetical protein [Pseudomonas]MBC2693548.1 hypothetical protein [Pseudomonas kielensis]MDD1011026.1 hypothetical protein [Pseudomonas shahriarae]